MTAVWGRSRGREDHWQQRVSSTVLLHGSVLCDQLRDLDCVQGGALTQIIRHDEEHQSPIARNRLVLADPADERPIDRKSTRLNSSHVSISYAVFCLKKKKTTQ